MTDTHAAATPLNALTELGNIVGEWTTYHGRVTLYRRKNFITLFSAQRGMATAIHLSVVDALDAGKKLVAAALTTPYDEPASVPHVPSDTEAGEPLA